MIKELIDRVIELKAYEEITDLDTVVEDCGEIISDFDGFYFVVPKDKIPVLDSVCKECSPQNYKHMNTILSSYSDIGPKIIVNTAKKTENISCIEYVMQEYDNDVEAVFDYLGFNSEYQDDNNYIDDSVVDNSGLYEDINPQDDINNEFEEQDYNTNDSYINMNKSRRGGRSNSSRITSDGLAEQMNEFSRNISNVSEPSYSQPVQPQQSKQSNENNDILTRGEVQNLIELIKQVDLNQSPILLDSLLLNYDNGGQAQVTSIVLDMLSNLESRGLL